MKVDVGMYYAILPSICNLIIMGRNLNWIFLPIVQNFSVVYIIKVKKRISFDPTYQYYNLIHL